MRLKEFKEQIKKKGIDCAILFNSGEKKDPNVFYFLQKEADFAFLGYGRRDFLITSKSEKRKFKVKTIKIENKAELFDELKKELKNYKTIGLNMDFVPVNTCKKLKKELKDKKFKDISGILYDLREIKTKQEIKLIKKSCKISDDILSKLIKRIKKLKTPVEAEQFLKKEAGEKGCGIPFQPIVTQNFKTIHPKPEKTKFRRGFCIIDFGVSYKGYCSDITRTVYIGKPSQKEKDIYNLILKVQKESIKNLKINKKAKKIVEELKKELGGYQKFFGHGLGHGIGVEIHELPSLKEDSKERIQENMVFTMEPGVYFGKIGVRIEDDILIKNGKAEVLTKTRREMIVI